MVTHIDMAADRALKAKHRALWALGDYPLVAHEVIPTLGEQLVNWSEIEPGQRVLDVATGDGNAAIPAARAGADVTASDLTPELLEAGRARSEGLPIAWEVADAEALPYADATFDAVMSSVGVMFAPHHQLAANEMIRVAKPGGTIALASWTPEGFFGQMFGVMKPYAPPPPPGALPPPLWGDEDHVRGLFGDRITSVRATKQVATISCFDSAVEFAEFFKRNYGPTIVVYRAIGDDAERIATLDNALIGLGRRHGADSGMMKWEYLAFSAQKV